MTTVRPVALDPVPPARARWKVGDLLLPARTAVMGVVNVTPDSFSDGGRFLDAQAAIAHGLRMAEEGADLLDVVLDDGPAGQRVAVPGQTLHQQGPGLVGRLVAGVGDGHHRDLQRIEGEALVDTRHHSLQRARRSRSPSVGSIQRDRPAPSSRFQKAASVFKRSIR